MAMTICKATFTAVLSRQSSRYNLKLWIGRNEQGGVSFHVISTTQLPSGNSGRKETPPMVKIEEEGGEVQ
jgi:hypothetical protein